LAQFEKAGLGLDDLLLFGHGGVLWIAVAAAAQPRPAPPLPRLSCELQQTPYVRLSENFYTYVHLGLSSRIAIGPGESHYESIDWHVSSAAPRFTDKQGQYLAFIYAYSRIFRRPPAEADLQRHFQISPPSVHQMVLTLERAGLIRRTPGVGRSIELLVEPEDLPILR
jgi:hypothetical protein